MSTIQSRGLNGGDLVLLVVHGRAGGVKSREVYEKLQRLGFKTTRSTVGARLNDLRRCKLVVEDLDGRWHVTEKAIDDFLPQITTILSDAELEAFAHG